jgi:hypothetical protein
MTTAGQVVAPTDRPLLKSTSMVYEGSFKLPNQAINGSRFGYGAIGLAYYGPNDSLFMTGHDWHQMVAEVKVPATLSPSPSIDALPTAAVLQPFAEISDGKYGSIADVPVKLGPQAARIAGLLPLDGKLYSTYFLYYDAAFQQRRTHFVSSLDLSNKTDARGAFKVGTERPGYTYGYMGTVPAEWRSTLGGPALTGACCLAIIGRTSWGPAVSTFDPAQMNEAAEGSTVPATALLYYTEKTALGVWAGQGELFNATTQIGGVVFPEGSRSVLFIGSHGTGPYCYKCLDRHGVRTGGPYAAPYVYRVWAYDAAQLADVRRGKLKPWEVKPYLTWDLTLPQTMPEMKRIVGATYDAARQRIFIAQANMEQPLIHAFKVRP